MKLVKRQPTVDKSLLTAALDLSGNELKVYVYLMANAKGGVVDFNTAEYLRQTGMSKTTSRKCAENLTAKGYMKFVGRNPITHTSLYEI